MAEPNTTIETLGLRIELKNFTIYNGTGNVHSMQLGRCISEYSALRMDVVIEHGGNIYEEALWIRYYPLSGIVCQPLIITTWTGDLYIHMHHTESMFNALWYAAYSPTSTQVPPEDLIVTVEIVPMVYLVWAGITLLSIGMAIPLIKEVVRPIRKKAGTE